MATLYVIATPIGNLEDITLRALRILKEVDLVLCEDTRVTRKLLQHFDINTDTESLNARTEDRKVKRVIDLLGAGKDLALVTDAGTPAISDPGSLLVHSVRVALPEVKVVPVPGPSAVIAALSVSGLPSSEFVFLGFLPHKKGRETLLREIAGAERTVVIYESPHRILRTLERMSELLDPSRQVIVMRELTKMFEETISGSAVEVFEELQSRSSIKGEFVVVIEGVK